jgi:gamma-glutamyltranspeptidase/glutathione hydrolase
MAEPVTIDGLGRAPRAADLPTYLRTYGGSIPNGSGRTVVPAAVAAWLRALADFGSLPLQAVLAPAIDLAAGFPVDAWHADAIATCAADLADWPANARAFLPGGEVPRPGTLLVQTELGNLLRHFVAVEARASAAGRERRAAIQAVRDDFYRGEPARLIAAHTRRTGGLLCYEDLADYDVAVAPAVSSHYRGLDVYACHAWSQGPVVPMALGILEQFDLAKLGHNTPDHQHVLAEALKLAFADREAYFGDPDLVEVPMTGLLSPA